MVAKKRKIDIPPRPKGLVNSLFWMATYHTWKLIGIIATVALSAYMLFCFTCSGQVFGVNVGSKPIETKVNINK